MESRRRSPSRQKRRYVLDREALWIGLAEVKQPTGCETLGDASGAFVNVIAMATDRQSFRSKAKEAVQELGLVLLEMEDSEPLDVRLKNHSIDLDLETVAEEVGETGRTGFGVFDTFD